MATQLFQPPHGSPSWFHACIARAKDAVFMETVELTPALAKAILDQNPHNRNIRVTKMQQYASDIAAGRWAFNGEPLIVAKDGCLNDGQHRCTAVVEANKSIMVPIMFGIERDTRTTVDQGSARIAADYLGMEGVENSSIVASAGRLILAYEGSGGTGISNANRISNGAIMDRVRGDDALAVSAKLAGHYHVHAKRFVAVSVVAFSHYILRGIHVADADKYIGQVCVGEDLRRSDPAFVVRERLLTLGKTKREDKAEIILRGWNAFRRKASPRTLQNLKTLPALV